MNKSQLEHVQDAKSFLVDKLGCGPEVRVIFDYIRDLEEKIDRLEEDAAHELEMRAIYND
ncbi:hypothetical protein D3C75_484180 [compost metagenome]